MCENKLIQYVPRGYGYKAIEMRCGSTGIYGQPLYCEQCEEQNEKRGHAPHQCRHGVDYSNDDGSDGFCAACEMGDDDE